MGADDDKCFLTQLFVNCYNYWPMILGYSIIAIFLLISAYMAANSIISLFASQSSSIRGSACYWTFTSAAFLFIFLQPAQNENLFTEVSYSLELYPQTFDLMSHLSVASQCVQLLRHVGNKFWIICWILIMGSAVTTFGFLIVFVILNLKQANLISVYLDETVKQSFRHSYDEFRLKAEIIVAVFTGFVPSFCFIVTFFYDKLIPSLIHPRYTRLFRILIIILLAIFVITSIAFVFVFYDSLKLLSWMTKDTRSHFKAGLGVVCFTNPIIQSAKSITMAIFLMVMNSINLFDNLSDGDHGGTHSKNNEASSDDQNDTLHANCMVDY